MVGLVDHVRSTRRPQYMQNETKCEMNLYMIRTLGKEMNALDKRKQKTLVKQAPTEKTQVEPEKDDMYYVGNATHNSGVSNDSN